MSMDQALQLAVITNDHFRAEALAAVTAGLNWRLERAVAPAQPTAWLRRLTVDVVLVDLDLPNALGLLREITAALPHMTVLALVTPQHLTDLQEALIAGAASFVTFPIDATQFTTTVMRVVQEGPKRGAGSPLGPARGRLVAVTGLKGGVGRTTLAVNMAVSLRQRVDGDVVLVEAHHGLSDAALMLNLLPRHTLATLAQEMNVDGGDVAVDFGTVDGDRAVCGGRYVGGGGRRVVRGADDGRRYCGGDGAGFGRAAERRGVAQELGRGVECAWPHACGVESGGRARRGERDGGGAPDG